MSARGDECERAKRRLAPERGAPEHPIARLLRACAQRIEAGEEWRSALGDYNLVLLRVPSPPTGSPASVTRVLTAMAKEPLFVWLVMTQETRDALLAAAEEYQAAGGAAPGRAVTRGGA